MDLATKERTLLEKICKKYNWKNPNQIKDLENPNFLSLEIELLAIDKQMMKFASSHNFNKIWRSSTWFDSLQKWFNRTERFSTSLENLLKPINEEEEVQQEEEVQEESWLEKQINLKYDNKLKVQYKEAWKSLVDILKEGLPAHQTTKKPDGTIDLGCWIYRFELENKLHKIKSLLPEEERYEFVKYLLFVGAIVPAGIAYDVFQQEDVQQEDVQQEEDVQEEDVQDLDIRKLTTKLKLY